VLRVGERREEGGERPTPDPSLKEGSSGDGKGDKGTLPKSSQARMSC